MSHAPSYDHHWSDFERPIKRWTPARKAALVDAVANGQISRTTVLESHGISSEEFDSWCAARFGPGGHAALRTTKLQQYPRRPA